MTEDHCMLGTCVLNTTTNCPEVQIKQKYECEYIDEEACILVRCIAKEMLVKYQYLK